MDPLYRPFFQHVWPICWPWLWWNLVRLTAWRMRTGRQIFILVDRFGNIYTRFIGDAPKPAGSYSYEAPLVPRWEKAGLASDLPAGLNAHPDASGDPPVCAGYVRGPP